MRFGFQVLGNIAVENRFRKDAAPCKSLDRGRRTHFLANILASSGRRAIALYFGLRLLFQSSDVVSLVVDRVHIFHYRVGERPGDPSVTGREQTLGAKNRRLHDGVIF